MGIPSQLNTCAHAVASMLSTRLAPLCLVLEVALCIPPSTFDETLHLQLPALQHHFYGFEISKLLKHGAELVS